MGKFTLRQIDSAIYAFDEDLKEYEDHVHAGDAEAHEGERLLTAIDEERLRRRKQISSLMTAGELDAGVACYTASAFSTRLRT